MIYLILILIILVIFNLTFNLKLQINWKSFFCKGFKLIPRAFRRFLLLPESKEAVKHFGAISFCIDQKLKNNCTIITNVKSFKLFDDTIFMESLDDIIDFVEKNYSIDKEFNYIIFYDEIFTLLSKNDKFNKKYLSFLSQLRKRGIVFITTAQEWLEINVSLRRYVRYQIDCKMISMPLLKYAICIRYVYDGDTMHWDNDANDYIADIINTKIEKARLSVAKSYDTFETIETKK